MRRSGTAFFSALILVALSLHFAATAALASAYPDMEADIRELAYMSDRSPGTIGGGLAAEYVLKRFEALKAEIPGAQIIRQTFQIPVIKQTGAHLSVTASKGSISLNQFNANALAPGAIADPGLEGPIVYVGQGTLRECNGLPLEGSIAILDMDSGKNWNNVAMLGARALIFLGGDNKYPRAVFDNKRELTPVDLPMFWISDWEAKELFRGQLHPGKPANLGTGHLTSQSQWTTVKGTNFGLFIPGSDEALAKQVLIVEAFRDSTAKVFSRAPGADEAASTAQLLDFAQQLRTERPTRSILLLSTDAHSQAQAGMREFAAALATKGKELKKRKKALAERAKNAKDTLELLELPDPLAPAAIEDMEKAALIKQALLDIARDREDDITVRLMRLRLLDPQKHQDEIKELADQRIRLKRLNWIRSGLSTFALEPEEAAFIRTFLPEAIVLRKAILKDASRQLKDLKSAYSIRDLFGEDKFIAGHVSLHLSSHGRGVGGFDKGWLYDLMPNVNRTRFFAPMHEILERTVTELEKTDAELPISDQLAPLYNGTLRPSKLRSWQSYLPDQPELGGEPMAIAGFRGFTLATVQDARVRWGTPFDTPEYVDFAYLKRQGKLVSKLLHALANQPIDEPDAREKNEFCTLSGRANLLRKGEIFPDKPGTGTVMLTFQWQTLMYGMVDTEGTFRVPGIASRKISYHKAVIEGMRFDPNTGLATWAINKPKTGKPNYRVKMKRNVQKCDLILFSCTQTTLFDMFDPRTFKYLYIPKLIDARTEAEPTNYWYSRLDTRASTLGTLFLEPDTPIKLTLSDSVLDKKVLLLNASPEKPLGIGYLAKEWPVITQTEFRAARDMWNLLQPRISNLETKGIINERVRDLTKSGLAELKAAEQFRKDMVWDRFVESSRAALAKASRVYNDVEKTQKDVLSGVLFYVALFIPFAFCMERLLFGFADIKKRIVAFLGLLAAIIAIIYAVHPAFELTYSPMVVILAFFILGLSLLVSLIIFFRFEREMKDLQRRAKHLQLSDISPTAAFGAAFLLGVGNLKRRPVRTALTLATLVILTFTVMNFTTVRSVQEKGWAQFSDTAPYDGIFLKYFNWLDIPVEAVSVIRTAFGDEGVIAPRAWYDTGDKARAPIIEITRDGREATARGMIGLSWTEPQVTGLDKILVAGRWFRKDERSVVMLPQKIADALNVSVGDTVTTWGLKSTVVGIFANEGLRDNPDLDGEIITPIIFPNEAATQLSDVEAEAINEGSDVLSYESRYQHIEGDDVMIIPAEALLSLGGGAGKLKGIAVKPLTEVRPGGSLGDRFGMMIFRGGPEGTSLFFTSDAVKYSGMANILIPLCISILIVLNTMIGSVYERKREIAVYTSIGLAPAHVAFLFVAEALAFGIISVVLGYLLAQGSAALLAGTPIWAGMTANYSSTSGVAAMILVIIVVLVSSIYPSKVAASIAIPDVNRSWTMPKAEGNTLTVVLPFLIKLKEQASAGGYLRDYYEMHHDVSHGTFCTDDIQCTYLDNSEANLPDLNSLIRLTQDEIDSQDLCFDMKLRVWLAPFDFGVRQSVRLVFCPSDIYSGFRQVRVTLEREAGEHKAWENLNRTFLNDLRKQLLAWRSLDDVAHADYAAELREHLAERLGKNSGRNKA